MCAGLVRKCNGIRIISEFLMKSTKRTLWVDELQCALDTDLCQHFSEKKPVWQISATHSLKKTVIAVTTFPK